MRKRSILLLMVMMVFCLSACAGVQSVKPYELGKVTAETILYQARVAQNQGTITENQFVQVRDAYDKFKAAQDVAIDARKAMIAVGTADAEQKAIVAMNNLLILSTEFIALAQKFGLMEVE
jgi:Flp pilus assembly protein TadD